MNPNIRNKKFEIPKNAPIIERMEKKLGALFDWDGVVVDSGAAHEASWKELARRENLFLPEGFFKSTFGKRNLEIIVDILKWTPDIKEAQRLSDEKETIYRDGIARNGLPTIKGAVDFIRALNKEDIPCAVGSSTPRENLEQALDTLGMRKDFAAFVTSEDVEHGKPAPDVYQKAAQRLGLEACDCAVFEDSLAGIVAAARAGAVKVALATTNPKSFWLDRKLPEERPNAIIGDFSEFSTGALRALFIS